MSRILNFKFYVYVALLLGIITRLYYGAFSLIEFGGGDSSARALITIKHFTSGYDWFVSSIWLPFYFLLYGLALKIDYSFSSLLYYQLVISILSLMVFYKVLQENYEEKIQFISILFISLLPVQLGMVSSVLSELPLFLFAVIGVYFYEKRTKTFLILATICFLAASMIRFEAWFFYIGFVVYDNLKKKSVKRLLLLVLPFVLLTAFYEFKQYENTNIPFAGLTTNDSPSFFVNRRNGFGMISERLLGMTNILIKQTGLLFLFVPFGLYLKFKERKFTLMDTIFSINSVLLIFGSAINSIAIFPRYWLIPISLGIPIAASGVQFIKNKYLKVLIIFLSLILINPFKFHFLYPNSILGIQKMAKLISHKRSIKKLYVDDIDHQYIFVSLEMYLRLKNTVINIQHRNEGKYIKQARNLEPKFSLGQSEYFSKRLLQDGFDAIVLVEGSHLYRLLVNEHKSEVLKEYGRVDKLILYTINP
jgi:hypothetical protein